MTALSLSDTDLAGLAVDALVVGIYSAADDGDSPVLAQGAESVAAAFDGRLPETLARLGATGAVGEVTKVATLGTVTAPVIAAVGLGAAPAELSAVSPETLRRCAASAVRSLAGAAQVTVALPIPDGEQALLALRAVAEGALLGRYRFAGYKSKPQPGRRDPVRSVSLHINDAADATAAAEVRRALIVIDAVALTRDWVNTPPNELRPPAFATQAEAVATKAGLDVEVLDEKALKKAGYGGILAVGMGSQAPPRLVKISYVPTGVATSELKRVALIGKGITFDTGGYAVKPAQGMWEMKSDMSGAAAVVAVLVACAALRLRIAVTGYAPMAENMISGSAYRPGDVVTMYGGKRVEVLNPDAEGRMILADAIVRAGEDDPDYLIETSTLTGGQIVSLGKRVAGLMGDLGFCERVKSAGERAGEPGWPMPLPDEVRKSMDSEVADITQIAVGMDRAAHMIQGGTFLREFVPDGLPWVHIDIAGPAYHSAEPTGHLAKGGTGVPVRLILELLEDIAAHG